MCNAQADVFKISLSVIQTSQILEWDFGKLRQNGYAHMSLKTVFVSSNNYIIINYKKALILSLCDQLNRLLLALSLCRVRFPEELSLDEVSK